MYQLPFLSYFYLSLGYLILLEFLKIKIKTNDKFDRNFLASKLNFNIFANIQKLKLEVGPENGNVGCYTNA